MQHHRTDGSSRADSRPSAALAAWLRERANAELEQMCTEAGAKPAEGESC
jgi:hypothetical protein